MLIGNLQQDLQAAVPEVHLALTRAGVTGVQKVIRIAHAGTELVYYADIDAFVDLDPRRRACTCRASPRRWPRRSTRS